MFGSSAGDAQRRRAAAAPPVEPEVDPGEHGQHEQAEQEHRRLEGDEEPEHQKSLRFRNAASSRSQSPSVESATWRTPAAASIRTSPLRSSAAATAKRSRSLASPVSTRSWRPVSGSTSRSSPTSASSCSRGSRISTASVGWRPAIAEERVAPVDRAAEVGDDHDERALAGRARRAAAAPRRGRPRRPGRRAAPPASAGGRGGPAADAASGDRREPNATRPSRLPRRVAA